MTRRMMIGISGAAALRAAVPDLSERARQLHASAFVLDAHVHVVNKQFYKGGSLGTRLPDGHVDLIRAKEGGLKALFFTMFISEDYYPARYETKQALRLMDEAWHQLELNRDLVEPAFRPADLDRINGAGKIAAILDLEGGYDLDGDLGVLRMLHRLGLRCLQLPAHNYANRFAESCCAASPFHGLTEHGRDFIQECNRLGMMINLAHSSQETIIQAAEVSRHPLLATHEGFRKFNDIPRTLTDKAFRALAKNGGVIGFHIGNEFHNRAQYEYRTKRAGKAFFDRSDADKFKDRSINDIDHAVGSNYHTEGVPTPDELLFSLDEWFKVVDHAIEVAGEDHVGLGTDFDGGPTLPRGMRDMRDYPMFTEAMLRRGWNETRIRKFLGLNVRRVFEAVTQG